MQNDYEETQFTEKTVQNINTQYDGLKPKEKAGFIGLFLSVVIPIVGIILYFVKKNKVANPGLPLGSHHRHSVQLFHVKHRINGKLTATRRR